MVHKQFYWGHLFTPIEMKNMQIKGKTGCKSELTMKNKRIIIINKNIL